MPCPHDDKRFCPLYVAAHMGQGHGCDDGRLGEGGCACDRGMDYDEAVAALRAADPRLPAVLEFRAEAERVRRVRANNLRLNGIH